MDRIKPTDTQTALKASSNALPPETHNEKVEQDTPEDAKLRLEKILKLFSSLNSVPADREMKIEAMREGTAQIPVYWLRIAFGHIVSGMAPLIPPMQGGTGEVNTGWVPSVPRVCEVVAWAVRRRRRAARDQPEDDCHYSADSQPLEIESNLRWARMHARARKALGEGARIKTSEKLIEKETK